MADTRSQEACSLPIDLDVDDLACGEILDPAIHRRPSVAAMGSAVLMTAGEASSGRVSLRYDT